MVSTQEMFHQDITLEEYATTNELFCVSEIPSIYCIWVNFIGGMMCDK